ncbi:serine/threonine-protein kinase [Blastopirellula retiformator]|uniref:Serine/threonine-protein kinase PrkC n=1 Tax=Blastopirellula retiformator TaxID=2527970 RepID=A0A5C5UZM4_9BACT|nr:serine/threonine-protein kinase [Blastopirellula retiformator]TWT30942.1 Serine/threonine-protein kinase PrkC [Blastopirellula retiformator]
MQSTLVQRQLRTPARPSVVGDWRIGNLVARGSFCDVSRAQPVGGKGIAWDYAIKTLRTEYADDRLALEMLRREVRVSQQVASPRLATVLAHDFAGDEEAYVVFPYLTGVTLNHLVPRRGPLAARIWILRQMAEGLSALHAAGWRHGDVKPENVIIDATGRVTLIDLGFATQIGVDEVDAAQYQKGTPRYMAPELFTSTLAASDASDIYSLGVLAFELLSGHRLFDTQDLAKIIAAHKAQSPPPLRRFLPHAPAHLATLVARMLAKDPLRRPETIDDVADQLRSLEFETIGNAG